MGEGGAVEERLRLLHEGLFRELQRHRPELVAVEDVFHARNARSALVLGQARGVALLAAAQSGAKVKSFAPAVIKQAVTGKGRAEEDQGARMGGALLGIGDGGRADATDALAAVRCGILRARDPAQLAGTTVHRDPRRSFARLLRGSR